jgi:hypothetical protein
LQFPSSFPPLALPPPYFKIIPSYPRVWHQTDHYEAQSVRSRKGNKLKIRRKRMSERYRDKVGKKEREEEAET